MRELKNEEMKKIDGGTGTITATMIGAIYKIIQTIYNIGDAFGSSIRRVVEDKKCSL